MQVVAKAMLTSGISSVDQAGPRESSSRPSQLCATRPLFEALLHAEKITPRLQDYIMRDLLPSRTTEASAMSADPLWFRQAIVQRDAMSFECAYTLRCIDEDEDPKLGVIFTERKTSIINTFDRIFDSSVWILLAPSDALQDRLHKFLQNGQGGKTGDQKITQFEMHLLCLDAALGGWRSYLAHLVHEVERASDRVHVNRLSDRLGMMLTLLDANIDTVSALLEKYLILHMKQSIDSPEASRSTSSLTSSSTAAGLSAAESLVAQGFRKCHHELLSHRRKAETLTLRLQGTWQLLSSLLELEHEHSLKSLKSESRSHADRLAKSNENNFARFASATGERLKDIHALTAKLNRVTTTSEQLETTEKEIKDLIGQTRSDVGSLVERIIADDSPVAIRKNTESIRALSAESKSDLQQLSVKLSKVVESPLPQEILDNGKAVRGTVDSIKVDVQRLQSIADALGNVPTVAQVKELQVALQDAMEQVQKRLGSLAESSKEGLHDLGEKIASLQKSMQENGSAQTECLQASFKLTSDRLESSQELITQRLEAAASSKEVDETKLQLTNAITERTEAIAAQVAEYSTSTGNMFQTHAKNHTASLQEILELANQALTAEQLKQSNQELRTLIKEAVLEDLKQQSMTIQESLKASVIKSEAFSSDTTTTLKALATTKGLQQAQQELTAILEQHKADNISKADSQVETIQQMLKSSLKEATKSHESVAGKLDSLADASVITVLQEELVTAFKEADAQTKKHMKDHAESIQDFMKNSELEAGKSRAVLLAAIEEVPTEKYDELRTELVALVRKTDDSVANLAADLKDQKTSSGHLHNLAQQIHGNAESSARELTLLKDSLDALSHDPAKGSELLHNQASLNRLAEEAQGGITKLLALAEKADASDATAPLLESSAQLKSLAEAAKDDIGKIRIALEGGAAATAEANTQLQDVVRELSSRSTATQDEIVSEIRKIATELEAHGQSSNTDLLANLLEDTTASLTAPIKHVQSDISSVLAHLFSLEGQLEKSYQGDESGINQMLEPLVSDLKEQTARILDQVSHTHSQLESSTSETYQVLPILHSEIKSLRAETSAIGALLQKSAEGSAVGWRDSKKDVNLLGDRVNGLAEDMMVLGKAIGKVGEIVRRSEEERRHEIGERRARRAKRSNAQDTRRSACVTEAVMLGLPITTVICNMFAVGLLDVHRPHSGAATAPSMGLWPVAKSILSSPLFLMPTLLSLPLTLTPWMLYRSSLSSSSQSQTKSARQFPNPLKMVLPPLMQIPSYLTKKYSLIATSTNERVRQATMTIKSTSADIHNRAWAVGIRTKTHAADTMDRVRTWGHEWLVPTWELAVAYAFSGYGDQGDSSEDASSDGETEGLRILKRRDLVDSGCWMEDEDYGDEGMRDSDDEKTVIAA